MKEIYKKRTIALCMASVIAVMGSFAADSYQNSLVSLKINSGSNGYVSLTAYTEKPYMQTLRTERIDDNTYYITLPGVKSGITAMPGINGYENIESMQVSTYPNVSGTDGYTRITVKTVGTPTVNAVTSLFIPDKSNQTINTSATTTSNYVSVPQTRPAETKQSSYWDVYSEPQTTETKTSADEKTVTPQQKTTVSNSSSQNNTQSYDFNPDNTIPLESGGNEKIQLAAGFIILIALIIFVLFLNKDKVASILGEQKDFDFDDNDEKANKAGKTKSRIRKIKGTINKLDNQYKSFNSAESSPSYEKTTSPETTEVTPKAQEEPEMVLDLDSLYKEKTEQSDDVTTDKKNEDENDIDDLADFLSEFSQEENSADKEDVQEEPQEEAFDEELYDKTINNDNLKFSDDDTNKLEQLLQNEIGDDTLNNIDKYAPKENNVPKVSPEVEKIENLISEYTIKQNISFSKDDVNALRKLMNVELDEDFVTDLKTNPKRVEEMRKEIEDAKKEPHQTSDMLILNVKDMLPDLSKELKKQKSSHNEENEPKRDVVYYSEGYDVSKLSVSSDLSNITKELHDKKKNSYRPSDEVRISEEGYNTPTLSVKDELPDIEDYKVNPLKYEDKKKDNHKADEKALLDSIANVQFKPFYEDVQAELSQFDGFEVIDEDKEEEKKRQQDYVELEKIKTEKREYIKEKQTIKPDEDAKKLLEIIEQQQAARESKKSEQEQIKKELSDNNSKKEKIEKETPASSKNTDNSENTDCIIEGEKYNIIKTVNCGQDAKCILAQKDGKYYVIGELNNVYKILNSYDNLRSENIQARVNEKLPDGSVQYIVRVSIHKFIVNITNTGMEFVLDLC